MTSKSYLLLFKEAKMFYMLYMVYMGEITVYKMDSGWVVSYFAHTRLCRYYGNSRDLTRWTGSTISHSFVSEGLIFNTHISFVSR